MNTFDLLGTKPAKKRPTSLDLLRGVQGVITKTEEFMKLKNSADALYKDVESLRSEIVAEGQAIMAMVGDHDQALEPGLIDMLPESLTVPELLRFAELHETLAGQGFTVRLLRDSEPTEHNWVAWGDSPIKGMVAVQVFTYTKKDKRLSRISLDLAGEATQASGTCFLSIKLHEMDYKDIDRLRLDQQKQLISFANEQLDARQISTFKHAGIRIVLPSKKETEKRNDSIKNMTCSVPAKLIFLLVKNDPKQVQEVIENILCHPLDHLASTMQPFTS